MSFSDLSPSFFLDLFDFAGPLASFTWAILLVIHIASFTYVLTHINKVGRFWKSFFLIWSLVSLFMGIAVGNATIIQNVATVERMGYTLSKNQYPYHLMCLHASLVIFSLLALLSLMAHAFIHWKMRSPKTL